MEWEEREVRGCGQRGIVEEELFMATGSGPVKWLLSCSADVICETLLPPRVTCCAHMTPQSGNAIRWTSPRIDHDVHLHPHLNSLGLRSMFTVLHL